MIQFAFFLILGGFITDFYCEGKRMCYTCDTDTSGITCFTNPENVTVGEYAIPCKYFCTIRRREYIHIPGSISIISLKRDCEQDPPPDGLTAGDYYKTYFRSCKSHLCNDGDGTQSLKHIPDDPEEEEEEEPEDENSSFGVHYCRTSVQIFKIYFFAFVASIFSIT